MSSLYKQKPAAAPTSTPANATQPMTTGAQLPVRQGPTGATSTQTMSDSDTVQPPHPPAANVPATSATTAVPIANPHPRPLPMPPPPSTAGASLCRPTLTASTSSTVNGNARFAPLNASAATRSIYRNPNVSSSLSGSTRSHPTATRHANSSSANVYSTQCGAAAASQSVPPLPSHPVAAPAAAVPPAAVTNTGESPNNPAPQLPLQQPRQQQQPRTGFRPLCPPPPAAATTAAAAATAPSAGALASVAAARASLYSARRAPFVPVDASQGSSQNQPQSHLQPQFHSQSSSQPQSSIQSWRQSQNQSQSPSLETSTPTDTLIATTTDILSAADCEPEPAPASVSAHLNASQWRAVSLPRSSAAVVLAGPGSGKTRVLVYRVAYLISVARVLPDRVLALTFTNRAAREVLARVKALQRQGYSVFSSIATGDEVADGDDSADCKTNGAASSSNGKGGSAAGVGVGGGEKMPWVKTFHGFARILLSNFAQYIAFASEHAEPEPDADETSADASIALVAGAVSTDTAHLTAGSDSDSDSSGESERDDNDDVDIDESVYDEFYASARSQYGNVVGCAASTPRHTHVLTSHAHSNSRAHGHASARNRAVARAYAYANTGAPAPAHQSLHSSSEGNPQQQRGRDGFVIVDDKEQTKLLKTSITAATIGLATAAASVSSMSAKSDNGSYLPFDTSVDANAIAVTATASSSEAQSETSDLPQPYTGLLPRPLLPSAPLSPPSTTETASLLTAVASAFACEWASARAAAATARKGDQCRLSLPVCALRLGDLVAAQTRPRWRLCTAANNDSNDCHSEPKSSGTAGDASGAHSESVVLQPAVKRPRIAANDSATAATASSTAHEAESTASAATASISAEAEAHAAAALAATTPAAAAQACFNAVISRARGTPTQTALSAATEQPLQQQLHTRTSSPSPQTAPVRVPASKFLSTPLPTQTAAPAPGAFSAFIDCAKAHFLRPVDVLALAVALMLPPAASAAVTAPATVAAPQLQAQAHPLANLYSSQLQQETQSRYQSRSQSHSQPQLQSSRYGPSASAGFGFSRPGAASASLDTGAAALAGSLFNTDADRANANMLANNKISHGSMSQNISASLNSNLNSSGSNGGFVRASAMLPSMNRGNAPSVRSNAHFGSFINKKPTAPAIASDVADVVDDEAEAPTPPRDTFISEAAARTLSLAAIIAPSLAHCAPPSAPLDSTSAAAGALLANTVAGYPLSPVSGRAAPFAATYGAGVSSLAGSAGPGLRALLLAASGPDGDLAVLRQGFRPSVCAGCAARGLSGGGGGAHTESDGEMLESALGVITPIDGLAAAAQHQQPL